MDSTIDLIKVGRLHLKEMSDDEFINTYRSSKHRYQATTKSFEWLTILKESFDHSEDLDIDPDTVTDVEVVIDGLNEIIERMHSASYWASESQSSDED